MHGEKGPEDITRIDAKKDLGIWLSPNLSLSLHLEKPAQKAFAVLRVIRRTFSRITRMDFQILYGTYVRPLLEYDNPVVYSRRTKDVILIERVQRAATKMVAGLKSMDYETRLVVLDLFPLEYRRLRGDLILAYALFEHRLANRFFTVNPANTRRGHVVYQCRYFVNRNSVQDVTSQGATLKDVRCSSLIRSPTFCECLYRIRTHLIFDYIFVTGSTTFVTDLDLRQLFLSLLRTRSIAAAAFSPLPGADSKLFASLPRELLLTTRDGTKVLGYLAASEIRKNTTLSRSLTTRGASALARNDLHDIGFYLLSRSALDTITHLRDDPAHRKKSMWQLLTILPSSDILNSAAPDPKDESESSPFEMSRPHGTCLYEHKDKKISIRLTDPLLFLEATRVCLQKTAVLGHEDVGKKATQKDYSQISPGCPVGPKSVVSGSMIGSGCTVGTNCRIINSVLLSGATVKDNCILQGCVLGENVTVESQCNLKNCAVASSQRVPDGTHLEAEQLGFTDPELEVTQT
ncbi:DNA polymerase epsilon subunit 1 [Clonorchis sinensis]|uniref:Translation initiation factor eIF2B subunit gamma n=1 Tax=Clonorchis sinensis TaxID=79923 RepID=G7Y9F8_CLOSI|nr:DNA polymerase epsilon subunit 1 [Clonorchis sinensis]